MGEQLLNSKNLFVDMDVRLPGLRAFGLLCHLDTGSGVTQARKRMGDITPHSCRLKSLYQKGYIEMTNGGYFAPTRILVNDEVRLISGFDLVIDELSDNMNIFLDWELRASDLRAFGILCKLDTGAGVRDLRQKLHAICGGFLSIRRLREKHYAFYSKGRSFVNQDARRGSGLAPGIGEGGFELSET